MVSPEQIGAGLIGFVAGIIVTAVGMMLADWFREYRNRLKPHIEIANVMTMKTATSSSGVIGFGVSIDQGETLNTAYVKFNGQRYPWHSNNTLADTVDMLVGEDSKWFYPYSLNLEFVSDLSSQQNVTRIIKNKQSNHGILVTMLEMNTGAVIFSNCFEIPKELPSFHLHTKKKLSDFSLTLLSKDIKHETKFDGTIYINRIRIGKIEKGIPHIDTVSFNLIFETVWHPFGSWAFS